MTTYSFVWPADTRVAMPGDEDGPRWRRLPDGRLEATYLSAEELALCMIFAKVPIAREGKQERLL